jgi:hypothetical protein
VDRDGVACRGVRAGNGIVFGSAACIRGLMP